MAYRLDVPAVAVVDDTLTGQTAAMGLLRRLGFNDRDLYRVTDPTDAKGDIYYCGDTEIARGRYLPA
jgi:hypothetical protein